MVYLPPLDLSLVPNIDTINDAFVIELYQIERKLAKLDLHKACGPDNVPNWF